MYYSKKYFYNKSRHVLISAAFLVPASTVFAQSVDQTKLDELNIFFSNEKIYEFNRDNTKANQNITITATVDESDHCTSTNTLDVVINNNSDKNLLITKVTIVPKWVYGQVAVSSAPVSGKYNASLDQWIGNIYQNQFNEMKQSDITVSLESPFLVNGYDIKIKEAVKASSINVKSIPKDKYFIAKNDLDRFEIKIAIDAPGGSADIISMSKLVVVTDTNVTLSTDIDYIFICTLDDGFAKRKVP